MKVAIITGTSQGLGLSIANEFAAKGWKVIGAARKPRPDALQAGIDYHQLDASDAKAVEAFWQGISSQLESAEEVCLVNNAGGYVGGSLQDSKPEDFQSMISSGFFTAAYMTRGLVRAVPAARIINVISANALASHASNSAYEAAKGAAMHFFHSLQKELKAEQYRITNVYPDNIASRGPAPNTIEPVDLAQFIITQAESSASYYLPDVTLFAIKK